MDYGYFLGVFFAIFDTLFTLIFIHCEYKCYISDNRVKTYIHTVEFLYPCGVSI